MKKITNIPVIDLTKPTWLESLKREIDPTELQDGFFPCIAQAYMTARKRLPLDTIARINKPEQALLDEEESGPKIAAARIGDIVIAKKFHPTVESSKAWLSSYHLELIKELFKEGFTVEILDDLNNPIDTIGETE
jgi:hypothetical protein